MNSSFEQERLDKMSKDPKNYKLGVFYFNPDDSRFVLPKRNKWFGWTLNFANANTYVVIMLIIVFAVIMNILS